MAQTTSATSARAAVFEFGTNGSSWTDGSGYSQAVEIDGGERATEETLTFDGDTPIITFGKREGLKLKATIIYTEGASEFVEVARAAYENSTDLYFRWTVKAATTGNFRYTSAAGKVKTPTYPSVDGSSAEAVKIECEIHVASVTKAAIP